MYQSNATSQGNPLTRHIIKSNDSIGLVWEVAFELHLLSPSDFNLILWLVLVLINDRRHTVNKSC